jgi:Spy/CpxP family protein refolding chaperone
MIMKTIRITILAIALLLPGIAARAQQGPHGGAMGGQYGDDTGFSDQDRGPAFEAKREEIRKRVDAVRIYRMTEELKLDEKTSGQVSSILSSFDQKRRDLQKDQMSSMRSLREVMRTEKPDEAKIKPLLTKLEGNHRQMENLWDSELKSLKDLLSTEQQARFILFQQDFQHNMRRMLSGARGGSGSSGTGQGRPGGRTDPGAPPAH